MSRQRLLNSRQGKVERLTLIRNRLDRHALHPGTGAVVTKGGRCGQQRLTGIAIGLEHRMDGGINAVEQANLIRLQSRPAAGFHQVLEQRFPQAVVLRINGNLLGAEVAQRLGHQGAGANRVLVEIQP